MKLERIGVLVLLVAEVYLGGWALLRVLEPANVVDLLSAFALC